MDKFIDALTKTPLPTILVVAGIIFLFLAIGGQLGARFSTAQLKPPYAMALGVILLVTGIWLQVIQVKSGSTEKSASSGEKSGATPQQSANPSPGHEKAPSETYALRAPAVKGTITSTTTKFDLSNASVSIEEGGKYHTGTGSLSFESTWHMETIAVENGHPIVLRQTIISDTRSTTTTIEGNTSKDVKRGPLEGMSVLLEFKNGLWTKTLEQRQPDAAQQGELKTKFIDPGEIYPSEKVAPGYAWQLKDQQLAPFHPGALSITGNAWSKFEGIEVHGGEKCAAVSRRVELVAKVLINSEAAEITRSSNAMAYRSLDKFVDIETIADGQMIVKSSWINQGKRDTMEMAGEFHSTAYVNDVTNQHGLGIMRRTNFPGDYVWTIRRSNFLEYLTGLRFGSIFRIPAPLFTSMI